MPKSPKPKKLKISDLKKAAYGSLLHPIGPFGIIADTATPDYLIAHVALKLKLGAADDRDLEEAIRFLTLALAKRRAGL